MRTDRDIKIIAVGIGFSLAIMSGFISWVVLSFIFSNMKGDYTSDVFILWIVLTLTPVLLMLKAYFSESLKNYQHAFFMQKRSFSKNVIFISIFIMVLLQFRY